MSTGNSTPHLPEDYDAQIRKTIPYYDSFRQEIINLVSALGVPPKVWLDTGCGTGSMARLVLDRFPHTKLILADPSEDMLKVARRRLEGEDRVRILRPMPTQDLPGELDDTPDLITAVQCHHYLSRQERMRAVRACFDLLPSGGALITFENVRPLTAAGTEVSKRAWHDFLVANGRSPEEASSHLARFDTEYFPITVEEHLDLLRSTGFRTVEVLWMSYMQVGLYCIR
ncbi:MAG: class I SAM-dependent methyltransferase [Methanomassiliicoccus sp.]|nr:class I SAM-dependent methyltransferase [Methanomassiliicoccus sp.]